MRKTIRKCFNGTLRCGIILVRKGQKVATGYDFFDIQADFLSISVCEISELSLKRQYELCRRSKYRMTIN